MAKAPKVFLTIVATFYVANGLLAVSSPKRFLSMNGYDAGDYALVGGTGAVLWLVAATILAPISAGPRATRIFCRLAAFGHGAGVVVGAIGPNYRMMGQSAIVAPACFYFGFLEPSSATDRRAAEAENDAPRATGAATAFVSLLAAGALVDGSLALFRPARFLSLNGLGDGGPEMLRGMAWLHLVGSLGFGAAPLAGPAAKREFCRKASCAFASAVVFGAISGAMISVAQSTVLTAIMAYFGFRSSVQNPIMSDKLPLRASMES